MSGTMGEVICTRRKALGMTQNGLAEKMGITDKAVSKWERDLSCPDIASIPKLAEVLGVSLEELLNTERTTPEDEVELRRLDRMIDSVLLWVGALEGGSLLLAVTLNRVYENAGFFFMAGMGLLCFGIYLLRKRYDK